MSKQKEEVTKLGQKKGRKSVEPMKTERHSSRPRHSAVGQSALLIDLLRVVL